MQTLELIISSGTRRLVLVAACSGAPLLGCASDHFLGDLPPPETGDLSDDGGSTAQAGRDSLLPAELGAPDMRLEEGDQIPTDAMGIGDFDGDGLGDFVTRHYFGVAGSYVQLRYGRPRPESPIEEFDWIESGARLAVGDISSPVISSVGSVGDVDADGYSDFVVHLSTCRGGTKVAYLVYGRRQRLSGAALLAEAAVPLTGPVFPGVDRSNAAQDLGQTSCGFGYSIFGEIPQVAGLGDFDGDGFDDFVLADPQETIAFIDNSYDVYPGGAYLFYGGPDRLASGTSWSDAAVRLHAPRDLQLTPTGDVNGDSLGDLILGGYSPSDARIFVENPAPLPGPAYPSVSGGFYWLPGRTQRLPHDFDLAAELTAVPLQNAQSAGDLDGDGLQDVLLYTTSNTSETAWLVYGAPGLFAAGLDPAAAAATFEPYPDVPRAEFFSYTRLIAAKDRDGDGDDELVASKLIGRSGQQTATVLSGSSTRFSGSVEFPQPSPIGGEFAQEFFSLGDLDGDGANELVTRLQSLGSSAGDEIPPDLPYYSTDYAHLVVHFSTPGGDAPALPR